jgi:hypothetical protein
MRHRRGDAIERQTLTADDGTWTSNDPVTYTYQWQRCDAASEDDCEDIDDATDAQYTATEDDIGRALRAVVTAINASGATSAGSDPTEAVAVGDLPALRGEPSMTLLGTPDPGSTLLTDGGDWDGASEHDLSYAWQRCDGIGASCETIADATAQSYDLADADVDHQIKVTITAQNAAGEVRATSDLSETINSGPAELMRGAGTPARKSAADRIVYYDNRRDVVYPDDTTQSPAPRRPRRCRPDDGRHLR